MEVEGIILELCQI